jgi:hypothetical protein
MPSYLPLPAATFNLFPASLSFISRQRLILRLDESVKRIIMTAAVRFRVTLFLLCGFTLKTTDRASQPNFTSPISCRFLPIEKARTGRQHVARAQMYFRTM